MFLVVKDPRCHSTSLERLHAVIEGRVQGVGFRAWTSAAAGTRGLGGWVKNRDDGAVEVWCEGPAAMVEQFYRELFLGPALANVEVITVLARHPIVEMGDTIFEIRR